MSLFKLGTFEDAQMDGEYFANILKEKLVKKNPGSITAEQVDVFLAEAEKLGDYSA